MLRAGLFERVSTEEQSRHGYSIETQTAALEAYAHENNMIIVDHYTDAGVSGGKPWKQRPELKRLIEDVEAGLIDIILFTKLDRWFRNVPEYYKVQEILDRHGVTWRAIWESYETGTANGKFAVNVFLAVAENERLRTSERIKVVFKNKADQGEFCFGGRPPLGYIKSVDSNGKRVLIKDPETKDAIQHFWDVLGRTKSLYQALTSVTAKYGLVRSMRTWGRIRANEIYTGTYNGFTDFCEPYVDAETFQNVQGSRNMKNTPTGRVYLFRGLIKCPACGCVIGSHGRPEKTEDYKYYRCQKAYISCSHTKSVSERVFERELLDNINRYLADTITRVEVAAREPKTDRSGDIKKLKERLRKLNVIYLNGNISDGDYLQQQTELKNQIREIEEKKPEPVPDMEPLRELLECDFESIYKTLTIEERAELWRRLIKTIHVNDEMHITGIDFL